MNFETATNREVISIYRQAFQESKRGQLRQAQKLFNKAVCMNAAVRLRQQADHLENTL